LEYQHYQPIGDKVLLVLQRVEPEKLENLDGILVDQQAAMRKNPMRETVVTAAGPECKQVRAGDTVLWNRLNGQPFPFGESDLYFLPENHLVCVTKKVPRAPTAFPCLCPEAPDEGRS